MAILEIITAAAAVIGVGASIFGASEANKASKEAAERQSNALERQAVATAAEFVRQGDFQAKLLEEDRRVQRLNADTEEVARQLQLERILSTQLALSAERFDPSTSRSFMALAEDTVKTAKADVRAIRLGAALTERRSLLEQEEILIAASKGAIAAQVGAARTGAAIQAAAAASRTATTISTVGSVATGIGSLASSVGTAFPDLFSSTAKV